MARSSSWSRYNPIGFGSTQVSIISSGVYIALIATLLWIHLTVPSTPGTQTPAKGLNLTQAWLDLDFVSNGFHPYNSERNDVVKDYLVKRIDAMLKDNGVKYATVDKNGVAAVDKDVAPVAVFAYDPSNITFVDDWRGSPWTCYGESQNILVYIRGKKDAPGDWWRSSKPYKGKAGVLINAHYDSVSSGFGATDDGVGVVTVLQLISYFTAKGQTPDRGIVALLNNGEEDGLYGAHSYLQHPLSSFAHTFLNLEGAGAGGRATLFRSTDAEITKFYARSSHPFGSVISGDGFKRGLIRSGTDYSVFTKDLGMRGLDVAFFDPRSKYHTDQDDSRNTSPESVWHMLSTSLDTMKALTSYDGDQFEGNTDRKGRLNTGKGSYGVWFDLFGLVLAVTQLSTMFALSVALLVAAPIILIVLEVIIAKNDKWYPFARKQYLRNADDDDPVHLSGFRGFFRFPIAVTAATAAVLALSYLLTKINPIIIYGSEHAVWTMMLSAWFFVAWFILAGADRVRPTALQRMYCLLWLYAISWVGLVASTVGENNLQLGSPYFLVIYNASVFAALLISYLELFALPKKTKYVQHVAGVGSEDDDRSTRRGSVSSRALLGHGGERAGASADAGEDDDATERTSLLRESGDRRTQGTFKAMLKRNVPADGIVAEETDDPILNQAYGDEQAWSSSLPQWTWILQFLLLAPINIVILGQISLLLTSALHQTPADGNSVLTIYLLIAVLTVLLLLPLTPFLHRFTYQIPTVLFLVFLGCLVYNLLAFPFSPEARMKHYFIQQIDLNSGINNVSLTGLDGYLQDIISEMPSSSGQAVSCGDTGAGLRNGLQTCSWHGLTPNVVAAETSLAPYRNHSDKHSVSHWLSHNITLTSNHSATFTFSGRKTKACRLLFDTPVSGIRIADASPPDPRFQTVAKNGSTQLRVFSRTWEKTFVVNVTWPENVIAKGQEGRVVCLWSDANVLGTIPAFDELRSFEPTWSVVTKGGDGLVEGYKAFVVK